MLHGDDWKNGIQKPIRQKVIDVLGNGMENLLKFRTPKEYHQQVLKNIKENITTEQRRGCC